ncbi:LysE family transporter [Arthrobacter sp. UYCu723]
MSFLSVQPPEQIGPTPSPQGFGTRTVLPAVGGLLSGHLIATSVAAAGVGALLASSPVILTGLTLAGAAHLIWLGIGMLRPPLCAASRTGAGEPVQAAPGLDGCRHQRTEPQSLPVVSGPPAQFTYPSGSWPIAGQIVGLGLVHVASCAVIYILVGTGARSVLGTWRPGSSAASPDWQ